LDLTKNVAGEANATLSPTINILHQHTVYGSPFPSNASPFPTSTFWLSGSSPRPADAAASSSSANACGSAASSAHREPHVQQPNRSVKGSTRRRMYYSEELKRQFCLFRMNWFSARTKGTLCESWRSAHSAFFKSKFQLFEDNESLERITRVWWQEKAKYLTAAEISTSGDAAGRSGGGGCRESAGNVGIGSEDIDSAGGGCDADAADTAPRHEAQGQMQRPPSEASPSSLASRVADTDRAAAAAVEAASDHASPAAAATAEGARAPGRPLWLWPPRVQCHRGSYLMLPAPRLLRLCPLCPFNKGGSRVERSGGGWGGVGHMQWRPLWIHAYHDERAGRRRCQAATGSLRNLAGG